MNAASHDQAAESKRHKNAQKNLSHIHPAHLEESIGAAQGRYASVGVLEPVMRIERSQSLGPSSNRRSTYRIIVHFTVQFSINNFDRYVYRLCVLTGGYG